MLCVAEVPLPVIVIVYVPAGVALAVEIDRVDGLPLVTDVGLNEAVAPDGSPLAEKLTVCAAPEVTTVFTVVEVPLPAATEPDDGLSEIEKSLLVVPPVTMAC